MANKSQVPFMPLQQNFTLLMSDGVTPFNVSVSDLDIFVNYSSEICINYGSQFGASVFMLVVVLLVTKEAKRKSPVFLINVLSLAFSSIRSLLQALYWVGPFTEIYTYFSGDFSTVPRSAYAVSITAAVTTFLLLCTVEVSLVLQTHVMLRLAMKNKYRYSIMVVSLIVALQAIGFRFALMVLNVEAIMSLEYLYFLDRIASAALITETISVWYFCLIFVAKLGVTIYQRGKMKQKQWSVLSIILIMAGCTMVIPSIFAVLEYFPDDTFPEAGSMTLTLVAIFLPLSSVWASSSIEGRDPVSQTSAQLKLNSYVSKYDAFRDRKGSAVPIMSQSTIKSSTRGSPENLFRKQNYFREADKIELEDIDNIVLTTDVRIDERFKLYEGKSSDGPHAARQL